MGRFNQCRDRAAQCRELAALVKGGPMKAQLLELAALWEQLAADEAVLESLKQLHKPED